MQLDVIRSRVKENYDDLCAKFPELTNFDNSICCNSSTICNKDKLYLSPRSFDIPLASS